MFKVSLSVFGLVLEKTGACGEKRTQLFGLLVSACSGLIYLAVSFKYVLHIIEFGMIQ